MEEAGAIPCLSLRPLEGMKGLDLANPASCRPRDTAALAAMMRLCSGWQKPGASMQGSCSLLSRSRFQVDLGYHVDVIAAFKQMPSKNYGEWELLIQSGACLACRHSLAVYPFRLNCLRMI